MTRDDPNWPSAADWLAGGAKKPGQAAAIALLGVPMNCSGRPSHYELAPAAIREALQRFSLYDADARFDLSAIRARDFGDIQLVGASGEGNFFRCVDVIKRAQTGNGCGVLLGGDNSITRLGVHGINVPLDRAGLLTFGAHHDLRGLDHGLTNANPVSALLRDDLPGQNVVQIGIQPFANSAVCARVAREAGITVVTAEEVYRHGIESILQQALGHLRERADAIYVNLDLDVLERAFAPACPGSRPGGLQPWMLRQAARICGQEGRVRMLDIVEIDPSHDIADATVLAAASFFLSFASGVALRFAK